MSLAAIALAVLVILALGYRLYGGFVARQYRLDPGGGTPAVRRNDGVDFVPTRPMYLLPQHFSAIAAAGPIAGPILACQQFGWLPALLWIGSAWCSSGRCTTFPRWWPRSATTPARSAEFVRTQLGQRAYLAIMGFIWLALIYVILAFTDVTASTFVSGDADTAGLAMPAFNPGGAVALASLLYLGLSLLMGLVERFLRPPLWLQTMIFVPATLVVVWLGTQLFDPAGAGRARPGRR